MKKTNTDTPIYDPTKTYEENYEKGPYGAFGDSKKYNNQKKPMYDFLGQKVCLPFGIAAGPLLNSNYVIAAFNKGFDVCIYKTVRSVAYPCHPFPNILSVHPGEALTLERLQKPLLGDFHYTQPLAITNSFNIPSKKPEIWQEDMKKAVDSAGKGQLLIGSFVGTVRPDQSPQEFIEDWATAARLVYETGVKIVEADLSCPNNGNEGLVCYNLETTEKICKAVRKAIGNTPFILKVGFYKDDKQLELIAKVTNEYADAIAAINTLPSIIVDKSGDQALPGKLRKTGGVCGAPIKWAGINMTERLSRIKKKRNYTFSIDGTGGVTVPEDYLEYMEAGADAVLSCTGAMWNPFLAMEIKQSL